MPNTKHIDAKTIANFAHFMKMGMNFTTGLVNVFKWSTRQFNLPTRFERHRTFVFGKGNHIAVFNDRFPVKSSGKFGKKGFNTAFPLVGDRAKIIAGKGEFFVFGTDGPVTFWRRAGLEPFDKLAPAFNGRTITSGGADSHKGFP